MKRLILMRHAKSDWSDFSASDHERKLNARGQRSAKAIGAWLSQNDLMPDHVLCSDAVRTKETLEGLNLPQTPTEFTRKLYLAEPDVMAGILRRQDADCILMLGHNPGTAFLAEQLLGSVPRDAGFDKFPTCATLVAEFEIETWRDLRMGTGRAAHFIVPRSLTT